MTEWSQLTHAYGPADDIPGLLAQAEPDPSSPVWEELWSRLCHQGTVYSASFAALPMLTEIARRWSTAERRMPLVLAGAIVSRVWPRGLPGLRCALPCRRGHRHHVG